jgi:choline dehydrogenase-like flavoprotein
MSNQYDITNDATITCSHLVIGSGPGGLTATKRLIEAGFDTILIEEGDFVKTSESQKYKNYQKMNRLWRNGGITTGFGKISLLYAEGSVVGGGSEINSGIMQKASKEVIEQWIKDNQLKNFSADILDKYYDKIFDLISPIEADMSPSSDILIKAAKKLNWKSENLKIAYDQRGNKTSVSSVILDDLLKKGLRLFANLKAYKINYKNGRAYEIECISLSKYKVTIKFDHLFLACGAIYSPFLLLKSGIKKSIGKTLQFHPTVKVGALFDHKINTKPAIVPGSAITEFMPGIRIGGSVFTKGFFGMFLSEDWQERSWMFDLHEYCGIYYAMIKPEGKARIFKLPFLPDPVIFVNFTNHDKELLKKALNKLTEAMFAAGAKFVYPSIYGHKGFSSYDEFSYDKFATLNYKNLNLMTVHAFSSLPAGEAEFCPVDSFGKLKILQNVFICDASIIPSAPATNPQATIMALVERNMDFYLH